MGDNREVVDGWQVKRGSTETSRWKALTWAPDPVLRGIVEEVWEYDERSEVPLVRAEPPAPQVVVVIELGDPLTLGDGADNAGVWQSFAAGLALTPTLTFHPGRQHCIEARLTPLGAYRLSNRPGSELAGRIVGLDELLGDAGRSLTERLAEMPTALERAALLERVLARTAVEGKDPDNEVIYAWNRLLESAGKVSIGQIQDETGWSRARLAARFREQVGLAPKAVARLIRFNHALRLISASDRRSLASVAITAGYYDQAHLNRDFRELTGGTPTSLIRDHASDPLAATASSSPEHSSKI